MNEVSVEQLPVVAAPIQSGKNPIAQALRRMVKPENCRRTAEQCRKAQALGVIAKRAKAAVSPQREQI